MASRFRSYTTFDREYALVVLERFKSDFAEAAKRACVEEDALRYWASGGDEKDIPNDWNAAPYLIAPDNDGGLERPFPQEALALAHRMPLLFGVAHGMAEWVRDVFLTPGSPLHNADHWHLVDAHIGYLWTNVQVGKIGHQRVGEAELVGKLGGCGQWQTATYHFALMQWFGKVPDFLIRLDAPFCTELPNRDFCALVDHELYHCAIKLDEFGSPRMTPDDELIWAMRRHDSEEFLPIVGRYGSSLQCGGSAGIIEASKARPEMTDEQIAEACGTGKHNPFLQP